MRPLSNLAAVAILLIILYVSCKKQQNASSPFPLNYLAKMGNTRQWHGTDIGTDMQLITSLTWSSTPYSYILSDTFALFINSMDTSVTSGYFGQNGYAGGNFKYAFNAAYTSLKYLAFYSPTSTLKYYYVADSIVITGTYNGVHGTEDVYLRTP